MAYPSQQAKRTRYHFKSSIMRTSKLVLEIEYAFQDDHSLPIVTTKVTRQEQDELGVKRSKVLYASETSFPPRPLETNDEGPDRIVQRLIDWDRQYSYEVNTPIAEAKV